MNETNGSLQTSIEIHDLVFNREDQPLLDIIGSSYDKVVITRCHFNSVQLNLLGKYAEISHCCFNSCHQENETLFSDFDIDSVIEFYFSNEDPADWWKRS